MKSILRRYGLGATLCIVGISMLFAGAAATLSYLADEKAHSVETSEPVASKRSEGLALDATIDVDSPLVPIDPLTLHSAPRVAESLPVPGVSVDRDDVGLDQAGLGLDADLSLAGGSHRAKAQPTPASVAIATMRAAIAPASAPVAIAAAAFTLAGLAAYFWGSLKTWLIAPFIGLYAKITRAEVFDNHVRERIFGAIRAHPGVSASDLARIAAVSWGTTIYHLDVLEQTRMVTSLRNGRYRRYFENGATLTATKEAVAVLQNAVTAGVVETIRTRPGATQKELAAATSMTPQALHWHLVRLVATGLVRKEREGRVVRHFSA